MSWVIKGTKEKLPEKLQYRTVVLKNTLVFIPCILTACSVLPPQHGVQQQKAAVPTHWSTPMVDTRITDLTTWWARFNDAALLDVIQAAQDASPSISTAALRIAQAQATLTSADSHNTPQLDIVGTATRGKTQASIPTATTAQVGLQASWELDLFGRNKAGADASQARLDSARAGWHDARVSVAAETAGVYFGIKHCLGQRDIIQSSTASLVETARLADLSVRAGILPANSAALLHANAQASQMQAVAQESSCNVLFKSLTALTGLNENVLRQKIASSPLVDVSSVAFSVDSLPTKVLQQRPDVYAAAQEIEASRAELRASDAARYPSIGLSGSIGKASFSASGLQTNFNTWAIGPLNVTIPIFDAGQRKANITTAQVKYTNAVVSYNATARSAIREVEESLEKAQSAQLRLQEAIQMQQHYDSTLKNTQARYKAGIASKVDIEDAKRLVLNSQSTLLSINADRLQAFITLYRAAGGGWSGMDDNRNKSSALAYK